MSNFNRLTFQKQKGRNPESKTNNKSKEIHLKIVNSLILNETLDLSTFRRF